MDGNISQQNGCQAGESKDLTENGTTTEVTEELKQKRPPVKKILDKNYLSY